MPAALVRRLLVCLAVASPAVVFRVFGLHPHPVLGLLMFGGAVVAASFMLAWAAEGAQKDISGPLAIAILALIAVLPEYAVDLFYAFRSGFDASYEPYAAANMTGSNRLLLGLGWPLVVLIGIWVANRGLSRRDRGYRTSLLLPTESRRDVGFLAVLAVAAFLIPILGRIPLWFGIILIVAFGFHLWRASQSHVEEDETFVGTAQLIADMPQRARRVTFTAMFILAAAIILACAEPFATALVDAGSTLGIDSYFLVQWLAPLASEAPEFIVAVLFALRGHGAAAIGTLIASKINQWSLLVGSLPVAHLLGGGGAGLPLDARQVEEFVLTGTQTLMGVAIIIGLRFHRSMAIALAAIFAVQFFVTDTTGRYVLSAVQLAIALVAFVAHREDIPPTLAAPFRRSGTGASRVPTTTNRVTRNSDHRPEPEGKNR
ncbi:sodium/hydrogen exchanger [Microbacterium laevaniformans]|uniref:sodium:proton exchanger n=1 Tax=Microbacterium laevaniformans TaxID=36807 RepID=UPI00195601AE|nr:sodium:proton exchanger [Microbacterium laevaniformans]MBM7753052.1 cation:H+ antiporter [Microbacterium laevaniformans]GLJ65797.1 sodium/calcium exchanger family protein [Microbacterium laevaniformans]